MHTHIYLYKRYACMYVCMHVYFLFVALLLTCCAVLRCQVLFSNEILYPSCRWKLCVDPCAKRLLLFLLLIVALTDFLLVLFLLYSNSIRFEHFSYLRFACAFVVSLSISYKHIKIHKWIYMYFCITHFVWCAFCCCCCYLSSLFTFNEFCFCIDSSAMSMTSSLAPRTYVRVYRNLNELSEDLHMYEYTHVCMHVCMEIA